MHSTGVSKFNLAGAPLKRCPIATAPNVQPLFEPTPAAPRSSCGTSPNSRSCGRRFRTTSGVATFPRSAFIRTLESITKPLIGTGAVTPRRAGSMARHGSQCRAPNTARKVFVNQPASPPGFHRRDDFRHCAWRVRERLQNRHRPVFLSPQSRHLAGSDPERH
jgi:hypothetical protein